MTIHLSGKTTLAAVVGLTIGGTLMFLKLNRTEAAAPIPAVHAVSPSLSPEVAGEEKTAPGPYQWRNVEVVAGGFVSGIVFHPQQKGLIYSRTDIGGAYRWDAKIGRWIPLNDWVGQKNGNLLGIESLGLDPSDPNRLYVAAGTYSNDWGGNGAILRSNDQGRTFQKTEMPFKMGGNEDGRSIGERLAVDPNDGRIVYFGSRHSGLWRSTDRAVTWNRVESFPAPPAEEGKLGVVGVGWVVFDARSSKHGTPTSTVYAGVRTKNAPIVRSTDGGRTWQPLPNQPTDLVAHHAVLDRTGTLFVTYGNGPGPNGVTAGSVWKCDTRSGTWSDLTPEKGGFGYAGLTLDAQHPGTVMVSTLDRWSVGDTLFRSTNGGKTWQDLKPGSLRDASLSPYLSFGRDHVDLGHWIGTLEIDPKDSGHVLYGTGATIWGTNDGTAADTKQPTHWTVRAPGLEETAVIDLLSPPTGDAHLLSGLGDIGGFRHTNLAESPRTGMYQNPPFSNTDSLDYAENAPNIVVRVGRSGNGTRRGGYSTDSGATWQPFVSEPPGSQGGGNVAVSADGKTVLWTPQRTGTFRSRDWGATWTACTGLPSGRSAIVADRRDADRFYAFGGGTLSASTDGGVSFVASVTEGPTANRVKLRATPGRVGDLWLAAEESGLWHVTGPTSKPTLTHVSSVASASVIATGKAAPGRDYPALYLIGRVGGQDGIFRSDDSGASWFRINDDAHQWGWIGGAIAGDPRIYGRVYVGTNGRGIQWGEPSGTAVSSMAR